MNNKDIATISLFFLSFFIFIGIIFWPFLTLNNNNNKKMLSDYYSNYTKEIKKANIKKRYWYNNDFFIDIVIWLLGLVILKIFASYFSIKNNKIFVINIFFQPLLTIFFIFLGLEKNDHFWSSFFNKCCERFAFLSQPLCLFTLLAINAIVFFGAKYLRLKVLDNEKELGEITENDIKAFYYLYTQKMPNNYINNRIRNMSHPRFIAYALITNNILEFSIETRRKLEQLERLRTAYTLFLNNANMNNNIFINAIDAEMDDIGVSFGLI